MKLKLAALVLIFAAGASSIAQTPPAADPLLCEGVKAVLAKATSAGWAKSPGISIPFDGGVATCVLVKDGKMLTCAFATLMTCSDKPPSQAEMVEAQRLNVYAHTRAPVTLKGCLAPRTPEPYQNGATTDITAFRTVGAQFKAPGQPTVRQVDTQTNMLGDGPRCMSQSASLEFDIE